MSEAREFVEQVLHYTEGWLDGIGHHGAASYLRLHMTEMVDQMERTDCLPEVTEELQLLRALWRFVWHELGTTDGGDHVEITWADDKRLDDLGEAIEDYYVRQGKGEPQ